MQPIVIVSGLPRSGTSLMMQMLVAGGLEALTDSVRKADEDNPRGYLELEAVKSGDSSWLDDARGKAVKLISELLQGLPKHGPYKLIFMRRRLPEVLASQNKMLARRGEPQGASDDELTEMFAAHVDQVESFLRERDDIDTLFVSYNRLVSEPDKQLERIASFLPELDAEAMATAIDPSLYRNRAQS